MKRVLQNLFKFAQIMMERKAERPVQWSGQFAITR